MHYAVYFPLLFSLVLGVGARSLAVRLPPAHATWMLSLGGLVAAVATGLCLALLGLTLVGRHPGLAQRAGWSTAALDQASPVPVAVGAVAAVLTVLAVLRSCAMAVRRLRAVRDAHRLAAALPAPGTELAIIDDPRYLAYAVPGRPGRIVLSTTLLRNLSSDQRKIVMAHERSHLRHHHHRHHALGLLACAVDPLLWRLPAAIALATERWADERAAAAGFDRDTVARTLFQVATGPGRRSTSTVSLAAAGTAMHARIRALLEPAPQVIRWRVLVLAFVLLAPPVAGLEAVYDTHLLFEQAEHAFLLLGR